MSLRLDMTRRWGCECRGELRGRNVLCLLAASIVVDGERPYCLTCHILSPLLNIYRIFSCIYSPRMSAYALLLPVSPNLPCIPWSTKFISVAANQAAECRASMGCRFSLRFSCRFCPTAGLALARKGVARGTRPSQDLDRVSDQSERKGRVAN